MSDPLIWFAAGAGLLACELMCPVGVFIFLGAGCLVASLAALFGLGMAGQLVVAGLFAGVSAALFRSRLREVFSGKKIVEEDLDRFEMAGLQGVAETELAPGAEGRVRIRGGFWRAVPAAGCQAMPEGTPVEVVQAAAGDSQLLEVKPADKSDQGEGD